MKKIVKYLLKPNGEQKIEIEMPLPAVVLSVHVQGDEIYLWAVVDPEKASKTVIFYVFVTGEDIKVDEEAVGPFIGTVHMYNGAIILHVFANKGACTKAGGALIPKEDNHG